MLIHAHLDSSLTNGPGLRAVLFLQGCRLGCDDCWNPHTHSFCGIDRDTVELASWVAGLRRDFGINGLTISGGEPMHQADSLCCLVDQIRVAALGLSVGMFSGYYEFEMNAGCYWTRSLLTNDDRARLWHRLKSCLDFAVLGRYNARRRSDDPLVSSTNQVLRLYTARYSMADFAAQSVEIHIDDTGLTQITGFPVLGSPVLG